MLLKLDLQSEVPIYTQLRNQIIEGIGRGDLEYGEALPSVRNLASDLGINLHTVNKAYTLLKQDGYIQIHRQKGVVVNPEGMPPIDRDFLNKIHGEARPIIAECLCRGMSKEELSLMIEQLYTKIKAKGR